MTVDTPPVNPTPEGISAVAGGRTPPTARRKLTGFAIAAAVILGIVLLLDWMSGHHVAPEASLSDNGIGTVGRSFPTSAAPPKPQLRQYPAPAMPRPAIVMPHAEAPIADPDLDAPITASDTGGGGSPVMAAGNRDKRPAGGTEDALSRALTPSDLGAPSRAKMLPHPDMTIPAGTLIPCTLQTAIDSELPGFVDCVLPAAVQGATGTVTLLDKGTQVFGEIRGGLIQGHNRLFILWLRARTPANVVIALSSPAADELGRSGVTGAVNNHWPQILLAATAYSLIGSGPQLAASALQNGRGNSYNYIGIASPMQSAGENAFQREMDRPPTLEKAQGGSVTIFMARDLDFSAVYKLGKAQ